MDKLVSDFKNPPSEFRGAPFWSWNADLSPERLCEQIRNMKKMGMGGFFMHSRVGLKTPYLGKKWFDCVKACIDEAKKSGVNAWLYDEDRWPSGAAGGIVTADDRFKMKQLLIEWTADKDALSAKGNTLAYFSARFDGGKVTSYRRIYSPDDAAENEITVRCYFDFTAKSSDFNGETYLDTLNEEAVKKFIEVTHEAYYRKFKDEFGGTIPGIFTDEPCYALPYSGDNNLPWTVGFEEKFQNKYGYDLLDGMIELFFDCGNEISRFRHDYYNLLTELFVNAFARRIGQWCETHGCLFTGHILWEDDLDGHTAYIGNAMRFYEYMQMPGIDLLTEHWTTYATAKQCTSIARQLGKKRRLSELYGCTGWDFPLFAHKSLGDWQYAMGINFRCHHLYWYSMEAEAKRDYPASISEHSPWYKIYPALEDHFARLGSVISQGEECRNILVIHPIESVWSVKYRISKEWVPAVNELNQDFIKLSNTLLANNLDFDYADEELLARYFAVSEKCLTVGHADYKAVVIPELKTIRQSTLNILKEFSAHGGAVFYLGTPPEYVDAVKSAGASEIFARFSAVDYPEMVRSLDSLYRQVSLTDDCGREIAPLLYHLSENRENLHIFICNTGVGFSGQPMAQPLVRERKLTFPEVKITIFAPEGKHVYEFDTMTGRIFEYDFEYKDGKYLFTSSFDELTSRLFVLSTGKISEALPEKKNPGTLVKSALKTVSCRIFRDEPNVLILDHADIEIDGVEQKKDEFILHADDFLRQTLGCPPRGGHMVQPYLQKNVPPVKVLDVKLNYTFGCEDIPQSNCHLAVEHPELYLITLNGKVLPQKDCGYWIDPVLRKIEIAAEFFKNGKNILTLTCRYHEKLPGLESIFILGEFGVFNEKIGKLPTELHWGNWCEQGFPAYGGNLTYKIALPDNGKERAFLTVPDWRGAAIGIKINGSEEKILISPPYRIELTDELKHDGNDIAEICIYGHRRNVFGPFYSLEKWPAWTGPEQFKITETTQRQYVPCGILDAPYIEG